MPSSLNTSRRSRRRIARATSVTYVQMKITAIPHVYRNVNRWGEILTILSKYGLAGWISRFDVPLLKGFLKNRDGEALAHLSRETRIRLAIEELGPTFIKFGQVLSTRPDQVGMPLARELQKLQTSVACDEPEVVCETIETELGKAAERAVCRFRYHAAGFGVDRPGPSGTAAVRRRRRGEGAARRHPPPHGSRSRYPRRPGAIWPSRCPSCSRIGRRPRWPSSAAWCAASWILRARPATCSSLSATSSDRRTCEFRGCIRNLSTARVLTMEWLDGAKLSDPAVKQIPNIDLGEVTRHGAEMYLDMIFHHGFYHGDPHPGNLIVLPDGAIGLVDFGMVARLDESLREDIEDMLIAIVSQDAQRLTSLVMRLGAVPPGLDEAALSVDLSEFVVHYANQPIDTFDLGGALTEMIEIVQRYRIALPSSLAMLIKVLVMLEGTARILEPNFSLMELIQPYQKKMLLRRMSPARQMRKVRRIYSEMEQLAEILPRRLRDILQQVDTGKFDVHLDHRGLEPSVNRLVLGMLTSACSSAPRCSSAATFGRYGAFPCRARSARC